MVFASSMAAVVPQKLQDLRLCAQLADYAYVSGKSGATDDELSAKWPVGYKRTDRDREMFYSNSWYRPRGSQHRFFKSHAYVCSLEETNLIATIQSTHHFKSVPAVKRIVVGFRGTWLQPGEPNKGVTKKAKLTWSGLLSSLYDFPFNHFAPSNYGLADIYYDVTLIRVPYRTGVVWKWYTYWGTLILGGSERFHHSWRAPRKVAAGLISRPQGTHVADHGNLLVHLGFWALWASPEGFAGYGSYGQLRDDRQTSEGPVSEGVLQSVVKKVREAKGQDVEILVVGHSLGGAVSSFAALDIIAKMDELGQSDAAFKKVKVIHATFGAPPVGTAAFAAYFDRRTRFHTSYAVIHEKDWVPKCFAWCSSSQYRILRWLRSLGWWSDWSRVGKELVMREQVPIRNSQDESLQPGLTARSVSTIDKVKGVVVGGFAIGFVGVGQLAVPLSMFTLPAFWLVDKTSDKIHYGQQTNPPRDWKTAGPFPDGEIKPSDEDKKLEHVGFEYHSLQNYIELLRDGDPFRENGAGAKEDE